ncbi:glutaredoxin family protein [Robertmurraya andreesenii]|uniref:Glutaredoxin n=1 Tax=Anoxybacillus andreesenii TaxID=1325932 RepID=A0ABT9V7Z1_9BACL|nr:glutaredoxin family protein [Robertmurraya andreesenii]MDQ0157070.1 glutaredoxin [Robertmurraya andreesenii]
MNITVKLYTKNRCHLCDKAKDILMKLKNKREFNYSEIDIEESDQLIEKYGLMIPVVEINGEEIQYGQIDELFIDEALSKIEASLLS